MKPIRAGRYCVLLGLLGLCFQCATPRVGPALVTYINQEILSIAALEQRALQRYASVTGKNFTTIEALRSVLASEVIPTYGRYVNALRNIRPAEDELKTLHRICLYGAAMTYEGFRTKLAGIEINDERVIVSGNEKIERGAAEMGRWRALLITLSRQHGVVQEGEKASP